MEVNDNRNDNSEVRKYTIIYVYKINDVSHNGLLKIGKTSFSSADINVDPTTLGEENPYLYSVAKKRVDQQNQTAGNNYTIVYWTLGVKDNGQDFDDNDVDRLLQRNGVHHEDINGSTEWYSLSIDAAKRAINAVKSGLDNCDFESELQLTQTQDNTISKTFSWYGKENRYFWSCNDETDAIVPTLFLVKKSQQSDSRFNRVLVLGSSDQICATWVQNFRKINLPNSAYSFYGRDNSTIVNPLKIGDKIADEIKCILYLTFNDVDEYKDTIRALQWDLIVIGELNQNITTNLENQISEKSGNSKWLYLVHQIPGSCVEKCESSNDTCRNQTVESINNQSESSAGDAVNEELIYFTRLSKDLDLPFTRPICVVINNSQALNCNSWSSALINIYNYLFKKYGSVIFTKISQKDI